MRRFLAWAVLVSLLCLTGGCWATMSKTYDTGWALLHTAGTETIALASTNIDGAHITWRGADGPITSYASDTGVSSATLPATPGGYVFSHHTALALVTLRNDTDDAQWVYLWLTAPWGTYYTQTFLTPGSEATLSCAAPSCYTSHIGETVSAAHERGTCTLVGNQSVGCSTYGTKTAVTHDPTVTIGASSTSHAGDLADGVESAELDLAGFTTGSNLLTYAIEGSLHVERKIVITYQPTLAAPAFNYPATGASLERDQIYFEAVAPTDVDSDAATIHFKLRYSTSPAMAAPTTLDTSASQANWTYWTGAAWAAFPAGGVAQAVKARYTPPAEPAIGTWYFDGQVKDAYAWCTASSIWHVHVLLTIWGSYGLEIDGDPVKAFDMEVRETANGELGQFRIEVSNKGGTMEHLVDTADEWSDAKAIASTNMQTANGALHPTATAGTHIPVDLSLVGGSQDNWYWTTESVRRAQTFIAGGCLLKQVLLHLDTDAANRTIYVELRACDSTGEPTATVIATSPSQVVNTAGAWITFTFPAPVPLYDGTYAIVIIPVTTANGFWTRTDTAYDDGKGWTWKAGVWSAEAFDWTLQVVCYEFVTDAAEYVTGFGFGPGTLTFDMIYVEPAGMTLGLWLSPSAQMPGQGLEMALADGDTFTLTEFTKYRLRILMTAKADGHYAPIIDYLKFTLVHGGPGGAMAYLDKVVEVGIRDVTAHTERWRGKVFKVEPGPETSWLICSSGDQILADRLIVADYASDDLGTTLGTIVTAICTPLVNTGIPALGDTGALSLIGKRALDAFEEVRRRFGVLYYLYYDGTDWIVYVVKEASLTAPTVSIMWDRVFEPPTASYLRFFPEGLRLDYFTRDATTVKEIGRASCRERV